MISLLHKYTDVIPTLRLYHASPSARIKGGRKALRNQCRNTFVSGDSTFILSERPEPSRRWMPAYCSTKDRIILLCHSRPSQSGTLRKDNSNCSKVYRAIVLYTCSWPRTFHSARIQVTLFFLLNKVKRLSLGDALGLYLVVFGIFTGRHGKTDSCAQAEAPEAV